ncbi:hypothetical protein [Streptomyces sp. VRA16 Mangrove soil]|uniref:hypothetical protein n=1 Tax=Streptomyces sp. VRA16 Mangrove soil TaxID=2817434 RepID=UPI001A9D1758|nr:hypothetical protein [Streptomyces sp. VRA16 Mangrove soil]MBO1330397.1 hypothetical protein [Streptomyces sp. VRA16 Mangrove soil]
MERVNAFLTRHIWAQLALSVLAGAVLVQLIYPQGPFGAVLIRTAFTSVGACAVVLAVRRKERRAAGGTDGLVSLDQRLRTGEAPTDPGERRAMRDLVDQRLHRTRHRKGALVFLAVMFVGITVLTGLTAGVRQTVGFAVLTVVFLSWMQYMSRLNIRRLRTMDAALRDAGPGFVSPPRGATEPSAPRERP